jgi:hypothetical protein
MISTTSNTAVSTTSLHGVFKAILNGFYGRGDGGVLYVKGEECAYRFPHEFPDATFRDGLESLLSDNGKRYFYVVEEKDGHLHVLAYERQRVIEEALHA